MKDIDKLKNKIIEIYFETISSEYNEESGVVEEFTDSDIYIEKIENLFNWIKNIKNYDLKEK